MTPPRFACWLLEATLPTGTGDVIAGDLREEFAEHVVPARGECAARWWFRWQVARSLAPLFFRSWQRATVLRASVSVVFVGTLSTVPAVLLLTLRSFVLQQVPLKTTSEMSATFAGALTILIVGLVVCGTLAAVRLMARR